MKEIVNIVECWLNLPQNRDDVRRAVLLSKIMHRFCLAVREGGSKREICKVTTLSELVEDHYMDVIVSKIRRNQKKT